MTLRSPRRASRARRAPRPAPRRARRSGAQTHARKPNARAARARRFPGARTALLAAGVALLLAAAALFALDALSARDYAALSRQAFASVDDLAADGSDADGGRDAAAGIDWEALLAANGECAAWLAVEGTAIDYPVAQASAEEPEFYLSHDFWGGANAAGCPYLDARCGAEGEAMLVYGHHLGFSTRMFSELFRAYRQDVFDDVGAATWSTTSGETVFEPLMAMSVDKSYTDIQRFDFDNAEELREWLRALSQSATATADDAAGLISEADRVLTLVTCSSTLGGQRERTLVVFVA